MECPICLEITNETINLFTCKHTFFHNNCVKKCKTCPLCRASVKDKCNRILIWSEYSRENAKIYAKANDLDFPIELIYSMDEWRPGDIVYCYKDRKYISNI